MSQIGETLHSNRQITPRRNRRHGQKRPQNGSSATSVDRASLLASPNGTIKINDGQFNASAGHLFNVTINAGSDRMPPNSRASERTILSEKTNQMPLRRSSNQDFKTSESEPETSLPITPTQESWDIYYRLLAPKGHGSPLYIPEPNNTLNLEYRRTGIRIGDVGIITSSGFDFLFNICLPANHPINPKELPETFEPLLVNPADIQKYSKFKGEGYLSSPSIKKKSNRNGDSSGLIFESSASEGALLTMPVGSKSEDLRNVKEFRRYFTLHAENWYKYVNNVRGREARNGDIRLVTGCDKTSQWGMATFSNSTAPNDSFHLTFRSVEQSNIGRTYVCQEYSGMTEVRAGPDAEEIQELRNNDPSQEGTTYNNQGLFVRSLSLTLNNDIWNKLATEFGDVHVDESPDDSYHNSRSFVPNSAASGGSSSTPLSQSTTTPHANSGACRALATINCSSNQAIQCAHFSLSSSAQALTGHPSDALNDMLLNLHPNARLAVTEDKDWISVMNENDATLPPTEELCKRMMSSFTFREEEGILFWEKKEKEVYNLDFPLYLGPKTLVLDWAALPEISSVPQDCPSQIDNDLDGKKKSHTRQLVSKDYYEPGAGKSLSQPNLYPDSTPAPLLVEFTSRSQKVVRPMSPAMYPSMSPTLSEDTSELSSAFEDELVSVPADFENDIFENQFDSGIMSVPQAFLEDEAPGSSVSLPEAIKKFTFEPIHYASHSLSAVSGMLCDCEAPGVKPSSTPPSQSAGTKLRDIEDDYVGADVPSPLRNSRDCTFKHTLFLDGDGLTDPPLCSSSVAYCEREPDLKRRRGSISPSPSTRPLKKVRSRTPPSSPLVTSKSVSDRKSLYRLFDSEKLKTPTKNV